MMLDALHVKSSSESEHACDSEEETRVKHIPFAKPVVVLQVRGTRRAIAMPAYATGL